MGGSARNLEDVQEKPLRFSAKGPPDGHHDALCHIQYASLGGVTGKGSPKLLSGSEAGSC